VYPFLSPSPAPSVDSTSQFALHRNPVSLMKLLLVLLFWVESVRSTSTRTPHTIASSVKSDVFRQKLLLAAVPALFLTSLPRPVVADTLKEELQATDVLFPSALKGDWHATRKITLVEGDAGMAEAAWRGLGGQGDFKALTERFPTRFVGQPGSGPMMGVVMDRGFETAARIGAAGGRVLQWEHERPNVLRYSGVAGAGEVVVRVWQRSIEQLDGGFGFKELYTIDEGSGPGKFERVASIKRRYRLSSGGIDGLEIMKTFRLLDGVVGDLPTSTMKTRIRLDRLPPML
jgi:hypothetical protein